MAARILARMRVSQSFADQSPGGIIAALASDAGVETDAGGAGTRLPRYVVDESCSVLDHIADLAAAAGRVAVFDGEGRLLLVDDSALGEPVATLVRGDHVLDIRLGTRRPHIGALAVVGAGAPDAGGNAWAWLRKSNGPLKVEVGDGAPQRRVRDAGLRAQQAVVDRAGATLRAGERVSGRTRILSVGVPAAQPGGAIELSGFDDADGIYFVTAVTHRFDTAGGFTSEIEAARASSGGSLLDALGGLGGLI